LTRCSADSLYILKVYLSISFRMSSLNWMIFYILWFLLCFLPCCQTPQSAHPAFDFIEFAANLKAAFSPCKLVQFVKRFINFRDTVDPFLNNCANTPGAEHFSAFRYQVLSVAENFHTMLASLTLTIIIWYLTHTHLCRSFKFFRRTVTVGHRQLQVGVLRCQAKLK
jgi:hypothetical protein